MNPFLDSAIYFLYLVVPSSWESYNAEYFFFHLHKIDQTILRS